MAPRPRNPQGAGHADAAHPHAAERAHGAAAPGGAGPRLARHPARPLHRGAPAQRAWPIPVSPWRRCMHRAGLLACIMLHVLPARCTTSCPPTPPMALPPARTLTGLHFLRHELPAPPPAAAGGRQPDHQRVPPQAQVRAQPRAMAAAPEAPCPAAGCPALGCPAQVAAPTSRLQKCWCRVAGSVPFQLTRPLPPPCSSRPSWLVLACRYSYLKAVDHSFRNPFDEGPVSNCVQVGTAPARHYRAGCIGSPIKALCLLATRPRLPA